ncbi:hypothetical protein COF75_02210 [Bacillus toyonensis]|nr:hypothetical protein CN594_13815 [Bacillus toyonensis]PGD22290.1 hypothetical protein COM37_10670 [Bacillus toyonensis]PHD54368.1 hypothetical protein COF75_02210 [Bacillus toyonensis]
MTRAIDASPSWQFLQTVCLGNAYRRGILPGLGGWWVDVCIAIQGHPLVGVWGRNPKVFVAMWRNLAEPKNLVEPFHCVRVTE